MGIARDLPEPVTSLVRAAGESDDPGRLIAAGANELRQPLGLVGPAGEELASAPDTDEGRRALAVAAAAARSRLVAPPGWRIVPIARASSQLGFLAIGRRDAADGASSHLVELLCTLLADQLQRVTLLRASTGEFVRRLVSDPEVGSQGARREAAHLGVALADSYWPALLAWRAMAPRPDVVEAIVREAQSCAGGALGVLLADRIVLLHPSDGVDTATPRSSGCGGSRGAPGASLPPHDRR